MTITVKVSELLSKAKELSNDGIEYVEITTLDGSKEEQIPAALHFTALSGEGGLIDYEDIEEVKISATYKFD